MASNQNSEIPAGWAGGFAESNPAFAYPDPDLTSLDVLDNMANIDLLDRQQKVIWPEFSWQTIQGNSSSRCFQMFAPDISRLGYTNEGRVYSIICPQQGAVSPSVGAMNVEVTVTGQRGWANEDNKELAADMSVEGKIWFSPSAQQNLLVQLLWHKFAKSDRPFPSDKAHAIRVATHKFEDPEQPLFSLRNGETDRFETPEFAKHPEAWTVGHLEVQIGDIIKTGDTVVDDFNELILGIFNAAKGNMLQKYNVLTWNVWFTAPELVDREEWRTHAEKWRKSIDADHGSPDGEGTDPRYFDGRVFKSGLALKSRGMDGGEALKKKELDDIQDFLTKHV